MGADAVVGIFSFVCVSVCVNTVNNWVAIIQWMLRNGDKTTFRAIGLSRESRA